MPFTKHDLNNVHTLRNLLARDMVRDIKKHLINNAIIYPERKQINYSYSFELGQDLLIERFVELAEHEFVDMVEHQIIVYHDHYLQREMMLLRVTINWEVNNVLNEAFVMYDSSDEEQQD